MNKPKIVMGFIYDEEKGYLTLEEYTKQIKADVIDEFAERIARTDINASNYPMNQVTLVKMQMLKEQKNE